MSDVNHHFVAPPPLTEDELDSLSRQSVLGANAAERMRFLMRDRAASFQYLRDCDREIASLRAELAQRTEERDRLAARVEELEAKDDPRAEMLQRANDIARRALNDFSTLRKTREVQP